MATGFHDVEPTATQGSGKIGWRNAQQSDMQVRGKTVHDNPVFTLSQNDGAVPKSWPQQSLPPEVSAA
jgi:hypothetical protein